MKRLLGTWILVLLAFAATALHAETGAPSADELRVFNLTNEERVHMGIAPLRWDNRMGRAAQGHAAKMMSTGRFSHNLAGTTPGSRIKAQGVRPVRWSENIYYGTGRYGTPDAAVDGWMDSSGHRANLLDRNVTIIGIGVRKDSRGRAYFVQNFARE